jgi:hypothetical protein
MVIFATPDFGASGAIALFLMVIGVMVVAFIVFVLMRGIKLAASESPKDRRRGKVLVLLSAMIPLFCCLGPPQIVYMVYGTYPFGSYPNNRIKEAMSMDEVSETLGRPHEHFTGGEGERWFYWLDSFGLGWFGVDFGPDGRVIHTYGN